MGKKVKAQSKGKVEARFIDLPSLLEQTLEAAADVQSHESRRVSRHGTIRGIVVACLEADRVDLAAHIVAATPTPWRSFSMLEMALRDAGDLEQAIDTILSEIELKRVAYELVGAYEYADATTDFDNAVVDALLAAAAIGDRSPRAGALAEPADALLEAALEAGDPRNTALILEARRRIGDDAFVCRTLKRWMKQHPQLAPPVCAILTDDPEATLALLHAKQAVNSGEHRIFGAFDLSGIATWSYRDVGKLAKLTSERERIYEVLVAAGRQDEATKVLMTGIGKARVPVRVKRLLMAGRLEDARDVLRRVSTPRGHEAALRFELGIDTFAELRANHLAVSFVAACPTQAAYRLEALARRALNDYPDEDLGPVLAEIEAKLAMEPKSDFGRDHVPECHRQLYSLRLLNQLKQEDHSGVRSAIAFDIKNFRQLKKPHWDGGMYLKAETLFKVALEAGLPDLALKLIMKIGKNDRYQEMKRFMRSFASTHPAEAMAGYDTFSEKLDIHLLDVDVVPIWTAALAQDTT